MIISNSKTYKVAESEESISIYNLKNMKKFIVFFMAVMAMFATTVKAQTSLMATLNHEGVISTFYGNNALQQAYAVAADGDVINLSSGTFQATNITKAITIRGAGMALDAKNQTEPTILVNDFTIEIPDATTQRLTIEGIYFNQYITIKKLKNALFLKNRFNFINVDGEYAGIDLTFIHCKIAGEYETPTYNDNNSASFQNCIVSVNEGKNFSFKNCILKQGRSWNFYRHADQSEYKNCIFVRSIEPSRESTYYNNLFISDSDINNIPNNTNIRVDENNAAIKNLLNYSDDNDYKLTEEAKALIKGTDGTEVGIYGGNLPFDPTPTNPQISKFNVAAKTTADGKLSVDIEVKSAE